LFNDLLFGKKNAKNMFCYNNNLMESCHGFMHGTLTCKENIQYHDVPSWKMTMHKEYELHCSIIRP
jgi:hypothetical protein